ncbi:DUF262 domain-containing protein [Paenibacillus glacialis]|uniref:GmrSD restriction endonucleases N-terminal domain-containing protein n=1 Tax=Paenibacillus glacialis TaxID=494026 RepID=A0A168C2J3_9BACL|nr:DUF262 domain-containing protein [Paenibacillus glacialis]OAB32989.1 hypothetical protein PGLA_26280 [Paenibacillus glacialis]
MIRNIIDLKTINDLLKSRYEFYIPSYQRGYRWNRQQVTDLLTDIWEFYQKNPSIDEFYCLQPIVVKPIQVNNKDKWEVIDGQQRLTTIYIIMSYIKINLLPKVDISFSIEYETRPDSRNFLMNMDPNLKDNNIDYFHIYSAFNFVKEWFESKDDETTAGIGIYEKLRNQTKVIWYQINDNTNAIDIFTRINLGKIPLTNAELIKALFLKKDNFGDHTNIDKIRLKQLEIANEWDRMEYSLQNNDLWFFLNNGDKDYETRIEFIFDMMSQQINKAWSAEKKIKKENNEFHSFLVFSQLFKEEEEKNNHSISPIDSLWLSIKRFYMTFEEWYSDRELYHLVGYIVSSGTAIELIKAATEKMTKIQMREFLKESIRGSFNRNLTIEDLNYETHRRVIKNILLLFNIISIQSNDKSNLRFPFARYKIEKWDIEHIHAVHSEMPNEGKYRIDWLRAVVDEVDDVELVKRIKIIIGNGAVIDDKEFEEIYMDVLKQYGESEDSNDISNLTLLDAATNRSYKNAIFPIKRKTILAKDKAGTFIPLCTKNVFLKYYSEDIEQMTFWGKDDRKDYVHAIIEVLRGYLPEQKRGEQ